MNDLIADLLARIQNGIERKKESVIVPRTKINMEILRVLKSEEMIKDI
jgi:ribosomal protein S8